MSWSCPIVLYNDTITHNILGNNNGQNVENHVQEHVG